MAADHFEHHSKLDMNGIVEDTFDYSADDYVVYGIHSRPNTNGSQNVAVRITMEVYTCIERIAEIPEINEEVFP